MEVKLTENEIKDAIQLYLDNKGIKTNDVELSSNGEYWRTYWATAVIISNQGDTDQ